MGDSKYRGKSSKRNVSDLNVQLCKHIKYLCDSYLFIYIKPVPPRNVWMVNYIFSLCTNRVAFYYLCSDKKNILTYNSLISKKIMCLARFVAQLCEEMKKW
jgi:hypothetical protein